MSASSPKAVMLPRQTDDAKGNPQADISLRDYIIYSDVRVTQAIAD